MKKLKVTLAIALPVIIALLAVFFVCSLNMKNEENDLGVAFAIFFIALVNVSSIISCIPFAAAFLIIEICLLAVKKQTGVACALMVLMTILLPVLGFALYFNAAMYSVYSNTFLIVIAALAAVYLCTYVLSILYFVKCRKERDTAQA